MADVGRAFNVSRQRIHQILNKADVQERWLKQRNKDKSDLEQYGELLEQALERYRNGEYLSRIEQELNIPHRILKRFLHRTAEDVIDHEMAKYRRHTKPADNGCVEWTGSYSNNRPIHPVNHNDRSALKWGWFYAHGEFISVKNTCGNRKCVSVDHMTPKD